MKRKALEKSIEFYKNRIDYVELMQKEFEEEQVQNKFKLKMLETILNQKDELNKKDEQIKKLNDKIEKLNEELDTKFFEEAKEEYLRGEDNE